MIRQDIIAIICGVFVHHTILHALVYTYNGIILYNIFDVEAFLQNGLFVGRQLSFFPAQLVIIIIIVTASSELHQRYYYYTFSAFNT